MDLEGEFDIDIETVEKQINENNSFIMSQSCIQFLKDQYSIDGSGIKNLERSKSICKCDTSWINVTEKVIGKGSAGEVRLGCCSVDGKHIRVAVKLYPASQKTSRYQLLNDLKTFLHSQCQYLVYFYGCYFEQGIVKQVIEYMDLGSLKNLVQEVKQNRMFIDQKILANITQKILRGLQYIHNVKRQVHRDIKPQNILINSEGKVKITDFGVSAYLQKTRTSSSMMLQGSPIYMYCFTLLRSPERIKNQQYSFNSDIWSLGIMLYEFIAKSYPYSAKTPFQLAVQIVEGETPRLNPNSCSPSLCDFSSRCLQRNPKIRASASQLLEHPWIVNSNSQCLQKFMKGLKNIIFVESNCGHP